MFVQLDMQKKINFKAEGYDFKKYIGYFDSLFFFDIFTGLVQFADFYPLNLRIT